MLSVTIGCVSQPLEQERESFLTEDKHIKFSSRMSGPKKRKPSHIVLGKENGNSSVVMEKKVYRDTSTVLQSCIRHQKQK